MGNKIVVSAQVDGDIMRAIEELGAKKKWTSSQVVREILEAHFLDVPDGHSRQECVEDDSDEAA